MEKGFFALLCVTLALLAVCLVVAVTVALEDRKYIIELLGEERDRNKVLTASVRSLVEDLDALNGREDIDVDRLDIHE